MTSIPLQRFCVCPSEAVFDSALSAKDKIVLMAVYALGDQSGWSIDLNLFDPVGCGLHMTWDDFQGALNNLENAHYLVTRRSTDGYIFSAHVLLDGPSTIQRGAAT